MYKVTITEVKEVFPGAPENLTNGVMRETVLLEQTLEKLDLRAVIDVLNPPPKRSHRRKEEKG